MRLLEVEKKAKMMGINDARKYSKRELIRNIQRREGNFDCFGTAQGYCDQMSCCWRSDCVK